MKIGIIDYGCGNLFSLKSSFKRLGISADIVGSANELYKCDRAVLPGVGAFGDAAARLNAGGLAAAVKELSKGMPLLGICLGMQLLFDKSYEYGEHDGLGLIHGKVQPLSNIAKGLKIPHIGWNSLNIKRKSKLLEYVNDGDYVYFVHSYYCAECEDSIIATTDYGGEVTAVVENGHVFGTQFHPEKSGNTGLEILRAFTEV